MLVGMRSILGQKLFEVIKKVWGLFEENRNLGINVLDGFRFSLVCLEDFEKLLVDFRGIGEPHLDDTRQVRSADRRKVTNIAILDAHLDFVDIANSMVKFNGTSLAVTLSSMKHGSPNVFEMIYRLILRRTLQRVHERRLNHGTTATRRQARHLTTLLLLLGGVKVGRHRSRFGGEQGTGCRRCSSIMLPACPGSEYIRPCVHLVLKRGRVCRDSWRHTRITSRLHVEVVCTRRSSNADGVRVIFGATLDAITRGEKSIKSLDQRRMTVEKTRNTLDDTGCIDTAAVVSQEMLKGG